MRTYLISITVILLLFTITGCSIEKMESSPANNIELTISAAASLKNVMEEIQKQYELDHPEVKLNFNFGGSGSLKQQIAQGAPVDLFFSAAEDKFKELVDEGLIKEEEMLSLIQNELVLVVPNNNPINISTVQDLVHNDVDRISIGIPETVPAGRYAKESLIQQKIWDKIESKIVYAKDVRQVLSYVETGNVAAGIVYKTDALTTDNVTTIDIIDSSTHTDIHYPIGIIQKTKNYEAAKEFYTYIQNEKILEVFEEYGFITK